VGRISAQLAWPSQDDLRTPVVALYLAFDFDLAAFQSANVAHLLKIARKDDDGKRAHPEVLTEVEKVHAPVAEFHVQNFAGHAAIRPDVFLGVGEGDALPLRLSRKESENTRHQRQK
jgi:hypothetical protein